MRTTITLADDVAAAVETLRRTEEIGISEAINRLVRLGLINRQPHRPYEHQSYPMGVKIDVSNIGEVLALLDESN